METESERRQETDLIQQQMLNYWPKLRMDKDLIRLMRRHGEMPAARARPERNLGSFCGLVFVRASISTVAIVDIRYE